MEYKLITSNNFIGTYFGHMVTISDLGVGPQSRPLPLVCLTFESSLQRKNFIGTYFGHMETISDLGVGPQSRPLLHFYSTVHSSEILYNTVQYSTINKVLYRIITV